MPFKDPIKKQEYNKRYCKTYYWKNREKMILRSVKVKKQIRNRKRQWIVKRLGGRCKICGYSRCIAALETHHRDKKRRGLRWDESFIEKSWIYIKKHIKDVDLLCSICHRELHWNENQQE